MSAAYSYLNAHPLLSRIAEHAAARPSSRAILDVPHASRTTYRTLLSDVVALAAQLLAVAARGRPLSSDLAELRVAVLVDKGYLAPLSLLATWTAGGLAVPLLPSLPAAEHAFIATDAECGIILTDAANRERADALVAKLVQTGEGIASVVQIDTAGIRSVLPENEGVDGLALVKGLKEIEGERRALMLYTSGTTGRPKGVVTTHRALGVQVESVVRAWQWTHEDNLLHVLPLNHLHGIVVALLPTLWAGAAVEMWEKFDGPKIWRRWINEEDAAAVTMFFGVPTVYSRLIKAHTELPDELKAAASKASASLRLQVSGSAPLPESVKASWEADGGVGGGMVLLERYGMTETGIIASTGWEDDKRVKGCVGYPMPNVEIRLWNVEKNELVTELDAPGEVQVRGPGIFTEYWRLPEITEREFSDGWFKTGDVAVCTSTPEPARGQYRILGRSSVDIIKSGGEKLSAIEIERAILELEGVEDAAVVGVEDEEWGQVVAACIVTSRPELGIEQLRAELRESLAAYKLPRKLRVYDAIPRNNMGKVQKKLLMAEAFPKTA
ncbi:hypothetical protein Q5752_005418 [Cryptotrichosporon argae]